MNDYFNNLYLCTKDPVLITLTLPGNVFRQFYVQFYIEPTSLNVDQNGNLWLVDIEANWNYLASSFLTWYHRDQSKHAETAFYKLHTYLGERVFILSFKTFQYLTALTNNFQFQIL